MKSKLYLLFSLFYVVTSCSAQISHDKEISNLNIGEIATKLGDAIMVIYQDDANNYWFGSKGEGVYKYDGKKLLHFTTDDGLVSNDIWGIQQDKSGNIYFDTQDGVSQFDGKIFRTLTVSTTPGEWKLEPDDLWFKGNWNVNGTYRYDGKNLHHLEFPKNKLEDSLRANFPGMTWNPYGLYSIYKDRKGTVWFGTSNVGIYRFDGKSLSWMYEKQLTHVESNGGSFGIRSMFEDSKGKYWFCNTRFRYQINSKDSLVNGKSLVHYQKRMGIEGLKTANGDDLIYYLSITEDNHQNLWMVTYDDGIWRYDPATSKVRHYPIKDGSKNITLFTIFKDNRGDLWVGTHESGVYKFNGKSFEKFHP